MVDRSRLWAAYELVRADLLAQRATDGHWDGWLSSSSLATATAISALVMAEQHGRRGDAELALAQVYQGDLSELLVGGLHWLANHQNADGGWGDTDRSRSNIATTMLVRAAFHLTGVPARYAGLLDRAEAYVHCQGGSAALRRRYGKDKTFAVPILTNCALAGIVPWQDVPPLPFELARVPQSWYRRLHLPVVSYAIPALVAMGVARFHQAKPWNPVTRLIRASAVGPSLALLERMQPATGGFLEAIPLTSFVVMGLASTGAEQHPVVRRGVEFLLSAVRPDGSWPIDTNLSVWNTTLALRALTARHHHRPVEAGGDPAAQATVDWLLACQHDQPHPLSGAAPGGWAWTDQAGGVPDVDDTSAVLLALSEQLGTGTIPARQLIERAALRGVLWLLDLQNADGGWPTFSRGWGRLPFDRSASDLTAHAMRALSSWQTRWVSGAEVLAALPSGTDPGRFHHRIHHALKQGWDYLVAAQGDVGSWHPLWFGNEDHPQEQNPVYGTARVLLALRDLARLDLPPARKALRWLRSQQDPSGGWGGGIDGADGATAAARCSVEETALATDVLLATGPDAASQSAADQGIDWLIHAVESGRYREAAPIGLYFAKLWYYEVLYPLVFTVSALGHALARYGVPPEGTRAATRTTA
ncbi:MAG: hypothetical protein A2W31_18025 [Planctomycetes bacterium RBG_16_64_10]|nr:MAG: hypothetical protein A2W31_18025 [Planctomycetes bacterium RBG_16_64_10]